MKKRSMKRALSAVLTLCMALPGASVAFGSASAATVSDDSSTSASSTAAGSLVEDDGFTWDNANVYFLLTDRFKNGNTANGACFQQGHGAVVRFPSGPEIPRCLCCIDRRRFCQHQRLRCTDHPPHLLAFLK